MSEEKSAPPVMNPWPKARFQDMPGAVSLHRDMVVNDAFTRSIDFAMLQYQRQVAENAPTDMVGAAAGFLRILGAQEFVATLKNLGESFTPTIQRTDRNLNHKA